MGIAKELTKNVSQNLVTVGLLKAIAAAEGIDLTAAADIATVEIEELLTGHIDINDRWLSFTELLIPAGATEQAADAVYTSASEGYKAGYFDGFADVLRILAKYSREPGSE